jgi:hypothetical protein
MKNSLLVVVVRRQELIQTPLRSLNLMACWHEFRCPNLIPRFMHFQFKYVVRFDAATNIYTLRPYVSRFASRFVCDANRPNFLVCEAVEHCINYVIVFLLVLGPNPAENLFNFGFMQYCSRLKVLSASLVRS